MTANGEAVIACSLKCYKKVMKSAHVINGSKNDAPPEMRRVNWNKDNANNSDLSSMKILIDWITTEGNMLPIEVAKDTMEGAKRITPNKLFSYSLTLV